MGTEHVLVAGVDSETFKQIKYAVQDAGYYNRLFTVAGRTVIDTRGMVFLDKGEFEAGIDPPALAQAMKMRPR